MDDIRFLVVHCSDTPNGRHHTAADIDRWHKERGWSGIGYHAVIQTDGTVEAGRPECTMGAHVRGHNGHSLGVCMIGRDQFSDAQYRSLEGVLLDWKTKHPGAEIVGHHDLDPDKTCPGFDVHDWWDGLEGWG